MLKQDIVLGKECLGTIKFIHLNYWLTKLTHAEYALACIVELWWIKWVLEVRFSAT